jgi:hypothetical protein
VAYEGEKYFNPPSESLAWEDSPFEEEEAAAVPVIAEAEPEEEYPVDVPPEVAEAEYTPSPGERPEGELELSLVPAEARPPQGPDRSTLPPEAEIGPIARTAAAPPAAQTIREEDIIPSPGAAPAQASAQAANSQITHDPRLPAEDAFISPVGAGTGAGFSTPFITALERGKYYVQLAAYTRFDAVEQALSSIGHEFPLAIQAEGALYKILLGPVNLGEGGALVQRFKGSGYRDAFIRRDG